MMYFVGIVPPPPIYNTIIGIQNKFGDNRLEPHITVRAPVNVTDLDEWIRCIEKICSSLPVFSISLPTTGHFGRRVLFVDIQSQELVNFYNLLIPAINIFEQADSKEQVNQAYHPHLTLGRAWCGFTHQDFADMKVLADEFLSIEPVRFNATFVRIYHKPRGQGRYQTYKDILLKPL